MKVGDLLRKRSTGKLCLLAKLSEQKYGGAWIKVFIEGVCSRWTPAKDFEVISASR